MQIKKDKIYAPIKGRVHKYLKEKGIRQDIFFSELGISDSSFKGNSGKSEFGGEILTRIVRHYPSLSAHWLLTGEGEMEYMEQRGAISSIQGNHNIVANGDNALINSEHIEKQKKREANSTEDPSWVISQLREKESEVRVKNEQISKLHELLLKAQETIHTLTLATITTKSSKLDT